MYFFLSDRTPLEVQGRIVVWLPPVGNPFLLNGFLRTFMIGDPEPVASALRSQRGVKDVDVVQFPLGKELWIVLRNPLDLNRLRKTSEILGHILECHCLFLHSG